MFDLGFWELALVALVALVVIGPERLPQVMRTTGMWLGRLRGMTLTVREELENELYRHELHENKGAQTAYRELKHVINETESALDSISKEANDANKALIGQQASRHSNVTKNDS